MTTNETPKTKADGSVERSVRPHSPHWTVRSCVWGGMAWSVSLTTPTKLELGARLYSRAEVDAMLESERNRLCAAIKAEDDYCVDRDYMLDSDDCIAVIRGTWERPRFVGEGPNAELTGLRRKDER